MMTQEAHTFTYARVTGESTSDEIRAEIDRLRRISKELKNEEQAIKLMINSIYGGLGNPFFVAFNLDVAEAVTLQGQNLIKFAERTVNEYFQERWHLDEDTHRAMGIEGPVSRITRPVIIYADTDSNYVSFEDAIRSCNWSGDPKQFVLRLNEVRLAKYLIEKFDEYAKGYGTENYQDFELENISESGVWLAKKKYFLDVVWDSGIDVEPLTQIVFKGVELAQGGTSQFARQKLTELVKYVLTKKRTLQLRDLILKLREIKAEFRLADPERIAKGISVNEYSKAVINDTTAFEVRKGATMQAKAAGYYNYLLNNSKYKGKYELIRSGDKIKVYYFAGRRSPGQTKSDDDGAFAFLPGAYPYEFAPPVDYDLQFANDIIQPINRITEAMGLPSISPQLFIANQLF